MERKEKEGRKGNTPFVSYANILSTSVFAHTDAETRSLHSPACCANDFAWVPVRYLVSEYANARGRRMREFILESPVKTRAGRELRKTDLLLLVCPDVVNISFRCASSTESMAFAGVRNAKTEMSSEGRWCVPTMPVCAGCK
jgi:hypothetical protein